MSVWACREGRVVAGMLWALLLGVGCNGASAPPASSSSGSIPRTTTEPSAPPKGEPQSGLPVGKVVLESAPRAPVELKVEIADTPESRQQGLMFREDLADDEGMFFVFDEERQQSFWMRNTLIPLDMFFIGADFEVVGVVENAEPQTDTPRRVDGASQYVLEVNGGFAEEHGLGAGARVIFTRADAGSEGSQ